MRLDLSNYGVNVTHVEIDSANVAIATKNSRGLPTTLIAKLSPPSDTIAWVYAKKTPTWFGKIIQAAGDSTRGYAVLSPSSAVVMKGKYERVRK